MADGTGAAYVSTTEPNPDKTSWCSRIKLLKTHLVLKILQLVFSLVAFTCEEVISTCNTCGGLYFFEFVSCSAVLLSILMLVIYCTPLKDKINIPSFKKIDFWITAVVGAFFFIASITFVATMDSDGLVIVSGIFGFIAAIAFLIEVFFMWKHGYIAKTEVQANGVAAGPEVQPLNAPVQAAGQETA